MAFPPTPSPRRILMIEDEDLIRLTVGDHLRDEGHEVQEAGGGGDGLRLFDPDRHDAVLLDLRLGDMDGHAILARIRRQSADVPVIIVSGAGDMQDVIKALRAGASDFLTKPILDFALLDLALAKAWERLDLLRERRRHAQELETKVNERTAELSQANAKLRESELLLRQTLDNIPEVFWLHRLDPPHILFVSAASTRIFGLSPRTMRNEPEAFLNRIHPDDQQRVRNFFRQPTANDTFEATFSFLRPDGEQRILHTKIFRIQDETGQGTLLAGITEDQTEYLAAQARERLQQERMIQADKMISLGFLAAGVAHEINNPNHLIRLNTQALQRICDMIQEQADPDESDNSPLLADMRAEIPGLLRGMLGASDRIRDIVQHMKDFARPDDIAQIRPVDLGAVLRDALDLLGNKLKNATNRLEVCMDEKPPLVRGNHQRLEQVVVNLLMNAAEALPDKDKGIFVTLGRCSADHVELSVRDEGTGMTPDVLRHAFDPFFTTKRDQGGLGLGLAICRTIVETHGGELRFESAPGGGTLARLILPVMERPS